MHRMWLLKAEPDSRIVKGVDVKYTIDDLERDGESMWEGVRNYQCRNFMNEMKIGDLCLFYRSACKYPAVVGLMRVSETAFPDPTAEDPEHPYYSPKRKGWVTVKVRYERHLPPVPLSNIKAHPNLKEMALVRQSRISISPVRPAEMKQILELARLDDKEITALMAEPKSESPKKSR